MGGIQKFRNSFVRLSVCQISTILNSLQFDVHFTCTEWLSLIAAWHIIGVLHNYAEKVMAFSISKRVLALLKMNDNSFVLTSYIIACNFYENYENYIKCCSQ